MVEGKVLVWRASQRKVGFTLDLSSGASQSSRQDKANTRSWRSAMRSRNPEPNGLVQILSIWACPLNNLWGPGLWEFLGSYQACVGWDSRQPDKQVGQFPPPHPINVEGPRFSHTPGSSSSPRWGGSLQGIFHPLTMWMAKNLA